jgi:TRAP-type C4-dicarboxylate transport system permease small subunit
MKNFSLQSVGLVTRIGKWLTIIAAVLLAVLTAINVIDIVGTKWFRWSFPGALDFSEELMVFLTLLPIGYVVLERGHINISMVEDRMPKAVRFAFFIIKCLVGIVVAGFLCWRTFVEFQFVFKGMIGKTGFTELPIWPSNLVVAFSFGFFALVWLLLLIKALAAGMEQKKSTDSPL